MVKDFPYLACYAGVILVISWLVWFISKLVADRSWTWRHGNFRYQPHNDSWLCPQDQSLWPQSADPEHHLVLYSAQPSVCQSCPVKKECIDVSPVKKIVRNTQAWPHTQSGKFHNIICIAITLCSMFLAVASIVINHHSLTSVTIPSVVLVLGCASILAVAAYIRAPHA